LYDFDHFWLLSEVLFGEEVIQGPTSIITVPKLFANFGSVIVLEDIFTEIDI